MGTPNYSGLLQVLWGSYFDCNSSIYYGAGAASNLLIGGNPLYTAQDFLHFYPQYASTAVDFNATTDGVTAVVLVEDTTNLTVGQYVFGQGVVGVTTIASIVPNVSITLSQLTNFAGAVSLSAYTTLQVPAIVLVTYVKLAYACINFARYQDSWYLAMGLFIAHYLTLYLQYAVQGNATAGQLAAAGLATGLKVSKSAGDVSASYQYLDGFEGWGTLALTGYGQQLITIAMAVSSGGMLIY
jgi:hypothetical protein